LSWITFIQGGRSFDTEPWNIQNYFKKQNKRTSHFYIIWKQSESKKWTGPEGVAQVVEHLPHKCNVLSSNPSYCQRCEQCKSRFWFFFFNPQILLYMYTHMYNESQFIHPFTWHHLDPQLKSAFCLWK
jgi:hypothetical protein